MSPRELRASLALAAIFGLRLFGMFVVLPVFALWAEGRPGGTRQLAGIAIGASGPTQAALQIPFGWLPARHGRKPVMYAGLAAFAAGSVLCALAESPGSMIAGRVLQGAGAISGVAIAAAADLTRETQRTKAMAIIGSTIGAAFTLSFVFAPFLLRAVGLAGIFALTAVLALAAIGVVRWVVPDAPAVRRSPDAAALRRGLRDPPLGCPKMGGFPLRPALMAVFFVGARGP